MGRSKKPGYKKKNTGGKKDGGQEEESSAEKAAKSPTNVSTCFENPRGYWMQYLID